MTTHERPLRIGYVMQADSVDMSRVSGPHLHVKSVIEGFQRRGHSVRTMAIQGGRTVWTDDLANWQPVQSRPRKSALFRLFERGIRGIQARLRLPFLRLFDSWHFSDACVSVLAESDILYERYGLISYGGLIAAKRLGVPLVYEVNGDPIEEYAGFGIRLSPAHWRVIHLITKQMFCHADFTVFAGETLRQRLVSRWHIEPGKVRIVTNGAAAEFFDDASDEALAMRARYGLKNDPVVVFVGGFWPYHKVHLLLEAFAQVVSSDSNRAKLLLVGDGPLRLEMERIATSYHLDGRVVFTGLVPHDSVPALLGTAQVAIASPPESMKLFEYMAAGKAIVATASPNAAWLLSHRGNALIVSSDSPRAIAEAIVELLEDARLRKALGQAARQQAVEKHSWDHTVSLLEEIMRELVQCRSKGGSG